MRSAVLDNGVSTLKPITWQFDNATNLIALMKAFGRFFDTATKDFWDGFARYVFDIEYAGTAGDPFGGIGLTLIGLYLGVPRPSVVLQEGDEPTPISNDLYRRLLRGYARLIHRNGSMYEINVFLTTVFGVGKVTAEDGYDMSIAYADNGLSGEEKALFEQHPEVCTVYPCGVRSNTPKSDPGILGLQVTQTDGQMRENFAATENQNNGGAFAVTEGVIP